jgi:hypothetical protein
MLKIQGLDIMPHWLDSLEGELPKIKEEVDRE